MPDSQFLDWFLTKENIERLFEFTLRAGGIAAGVVDGGEFTFEDNFLKIGPHTTIGPEGEPLDGWEAHPLTPRDTISTVNNFANEELTLDMSQYAGSTVYVTVRPSIRRARNFIQPGQIEILTSLGSRPTEGPLNLSVVLGTVTLDGDGNITGVDAGSGSSAQEGRNVVANVDIGDLPPGLGGGGGLTFEVLDGVFRTMITENKIEMNASEFEAEMTLRKPDGTPLTTAWATGIASDRDSVTDIDVGSIPLADTTSAQIVKSGTGGTAYEQGDNFSSFCPFFIEKDDNFGTEIQMSQVFQDGSPLSFSAVTIPFAAAPGIINPGDKVRVRIETDSAGDPSGTLADPNGEVDFLDTELAALGGPIGPEFPNQGITKAFPGTVNLAALTDYHIVFSVILANPGSASNLCMWGMDSSVPASLYSEAKVRQDGGAGFGGWIDQSLLFLNPPLSIPFALSSAAPAEGLIDLTGKPLGGRTVAVRIRLQDSDTNVPRLGVMWIEDEDVYRVVPSTRKVLSSFVDVAVAYEIKFDAGPFTPASPFINITP